MGAIVKMKLQIVKHGPSDVATVVIISSIRRVILRIQLISEALLIRIITIRMMIRTRSNSDYQLRNNLKYRLSNIVAVKDSDKTSHKHNHNTTRNNATHSDDAANS